MKIVIVGDGKVGYTLTEQLSKEGHDIVVIDHDAQTLKHTADMFDVIDVHGNGASYSVLKQAGVSKADLVIAATSTDELNLLCCLVAKKLGAKRTIARVRNPEYSEQLILMKDELGLSMAINPELAAAAEISRMLRFPSAIKIEPYAKGRVEIVEFKLIAGNPICDRTISEVRSQYRMKIVVCAVLREDDIFIPSGDFVFQAGDNVCLIAAAEQISAFFKAIGIVKGKVKNVLIIGGGKICYYLAKQLLDFGMNVKIVEKNPQKCDALCEMLPKAMVICADGTDQDLLNEEGITGMDAFVSLTGIDEQNIIMAMYATAVQVKKVVAKINKQSFINMYNDISDGAQSVVTPALITSNQIVSYVRALTNSTGSNVLTLHRIMNNSVEALEFCVRENTTFVSQPIKTLKLKKELLIACIIRRGSPIIPGGEDTIELKDSVIIVTTNARFDDLNDILV